jgi:molecular chaperone GrpE (heat shock protein)
VRRNLGSVPRDGDLYRRYLGQLSDQEDRLAKIRTELESLRKGFEEAREAMAKYARGLNL